MATYKVIQDIEAEDKLVGPLTLRQFIYGAIAAIFAYLSFIAISKGFPLALTIFGPPMLFTAFFAFPWGRDQPTEVWALAKLRFYFKSRRRLWDQSGVKNLVTITAPKHEVKVRSNGLSAHEVQSRLSALASTLDSRGWAVKNVYSIPPMVTQQATDRLIDFSNLPQEVAPTGITEADDILADDNARAHQLNEMVTAATSSHKQELLERMKHGDMSLPAPTGQQPADTKWFTTNPISVPQAATVEVSEAALSNELHERRDVETTEHLKTIKPLAPASMQPVVPPAVTPTPDPATIHLSQRDDLNISTIARMAKGEDEVVISLH